jgi:hypothetical protein
MSLRLPTRTLAPILVLAVLGGIVATFMVARPPSSAGDETPSLVRPKLAKPAPVRKPATAKVKAPAKVKVPARTPAAKAPVKAPAAKPKPVAPASPVADEKGLPRVLKAALADNRVVVVGLHDPDSALDRMALAEARAGAKAAGVGFVAINVLAESQSRPLLELLGALENPGILVYRKPDVLFARMSGFADSETVAQAAANARR